MVKRNNKINNWGEFIYRNLQGGFVSLCWFRGTKVLNTCSIRFEFSVSSLINSFKLYFVRMRGNITWFHEIYSECYPCLTMKKRGNYRLSKLHGVYGNDNCHMLSMWSRNRPQLLSDAKKKNWISCHMIIYRYVRYSVTSNGLFFYCDEEFINHNVSWLRV